MHNIKYWLLFSLPLFLGLQLAVTSCSGEKSSDDEIISISSKKKTLTLKVGTTFPLALTTVSSSGSVADYDLEKNELGLEFSSSDTNVATVSGNGTVTAVRRGQATITVSNSTMRCVIGCTVERVGDIYDPSKKWSDDMAFFCSSLGGFTDAQCFDIDSKGNIWHAATKLRGEVGYLTIIKSSPDGKILGEMPLYYAGHGQVFSIEEAPDGEFVWISNCGSVASDGRGYSTSTMGSRIKFEPGVGKTPDDVASTSFAISGTKSVNVSIDRITGNVAYSYYKDNSNITINVYKKEAILGAPMKEMSFNVTRGSSMTGQITDSKPVTVKLTVHDLGALSPLYSFTVAKTAVFGKTSAGKLKRDQGFCFYDGCCYFVGDSNGSLRDADISCVKLDGTVVKAPAHIDAISDPEPLLKCGFGVSSGYFESEGVQIVDDKLHVGFLCWDSTCQNSILRLK